MGDDEVQSNSAPVPVDPYRTTIYEQLRGRAAGLLRRRGDHRDPGTISLVNDVLLGVMRTDRTGNLPEFESEAELLKYLSRAMRNHLVNRALARQAQRRPPEERQVAWPQSQSFPAASRPANDVLDVHEALEKLADHDQRAAQVVELIFFGGCTQGEVAEILDQPPRAIRSDWEFARAWLRDKLKNC